MTKKTTYRQMQTVCEERYDERRIMRLHFMFVDDEMFFQLVQTGLVDKIVKVFQEADRKKKETSSQMNDQKRTREEDEENSSTDLHSTEKRIKRWHILMADASTQTGNSF